MDKVTDCIYKICCRICFIVVGFICMYMFLNSILSTSVMAYEDEHTFFIKDFPLLIMGGLVFLVGLVVLCKKWISKILENSLGWMCAATVVWLGLLIVFVTNSDVKMVYDQIFVYNGITDFLNGDLSAWQVGGYFYNYPMQNGLLLLFAPVVALCGAFSYEVVQGINLLCLWFVALGCYKLAKKYFGNSVAVFTYVGTLMFIPLWGYVKYFYGNLIGLSLIVFAVYWLTCYLESKKNRYLWGCVGCTLVALMSKSNFSIFVVAMIIVLILQGLKQKEFKFFVAGILLLTAMIVGMKGPALAVHMFTGCVTDQGVPTIRWIAIGVSESSTAPGWYGEDTHDWFAENNHSVAVAKESALESVKNSLQGFATDKWYACRFFARKFASIWNNPTFESFAVVIKGNLDGSLSYWMKDILYNGGIVNTILTLLMDVLQSVYLFGLLLYLVCCKKHRKLKNAVPLIALIGGVLFHMFWEGKCQYTVLYFPLLFPHVSEGYRRCAESIFWWLHSERGKSGMLRRLPKAMLKSAECRWLLVLCVVIVVISLGNSELFTSTVKLQNDTADYIWYCTEGDDWKAEDYANQ